MAGWLTKHRFAARVTCRSSNNARRACSKFRSTSRKCTSRMADILTMHWTNDRPNAKKRSAQLFRSAHVTGRRAGSGSVMKLVVNGTAHSVDVDADTPLLWVLRDVLGMSGTKFGCGIALCGACTVHLDGKPVRSCITPVSAAACKRITTIEAIGATPAGNKIHQAWIELEVPQC